MSQMAESVTVYETNSALDAPATYLKGKKSATPLSEPPRLNTGGDFSTLELPFFVPINEKTGGLIGAINRLNDQLIHAHRAPIISKKKPYQWLGRTIEPGQVGLYTRGGFPKILIKPGRYPGFPFGNWIARKWTGVAPLSSSVLEHHGLVFVQVSGNQAAVVSDPSNKVFVVKNGGFVSLSIEGTYSVLGVVDQVNLSHTEVDPLAGGSEVRVLGHSEKVNWVTQLGSPHSQPKTFVAATFLDIPANNLVVLQSGDHLEVLPAGQHCITNPNITVRGWFSKGECQLELASREMLTKDQVSLEIKVYLRWELVEPLKLCHHGYEAPFAALKDKTLSVLTQVVGHLEYSSMLKQRSFAPGDHASDGPDPSSSAFLDALRTNALDDLRQSALEYGIILKDLAVIDRNFKGEIAKQMNALTTRALQNQVEASNVERENSNRVKKEEGSLEVAKVQALQRQTEADAQAYSVVTQAQAEARAILITAESQAEAVRLAAKAEADAILNRKQVDELVKDEHARAAQLARIDVSRVAAFGNRTTFVGVGTGEVGNNVIAGHALAIGSRA